MSHQDEPRPDPGSLRERAKALTSADKTLPLDPLAPEEAARALQELRIHQIELQMQNEELRRAQVELDAARARYFELFDLAPVGYVSVSETGLILETNFTAARLLGLERGALVRRRLASFILPEDGDIYYLQLKQLQEGGLPRASEVRMTRAGGAPFWASLEAAKAEGAAGAPAFRVVISDITERKRTEEELRASEARHRALFENNLDAVFATSPDGGVMAANPAACAMFGMTEEELCRTGRQGIIDLDDPRLAPGLEERARTGKFYGELSFVRKGGAKFSCEVNSVILPGEEPRAFVILHDITNRKQAEAALIRSEKLASVGRMAASIAHEINNPLASVTNALYLAIQGEGLPRATRHYLGIMDQELKRVVHITRQSLGFYRESTAPAPTSVRAALESAVDLLQGRIKTKKATVEKQWNGETEVVAVAGELRQVFCNLLANSLDAIDNQGVIRLRISQGTTFQGGRPYVRVLVADNGKGMDAAVRKRLFEPFFTTKETIGTGLGLWVSKQLVDKNGGTIAVRSRSDGAHRGTVFSIILPVERRRQPAASPELA
jgi:PAS domain S-box-containing protein